jgi:Tfp pilus assembly protein FimT
MGKIRKNEAGFGAVELLIILAVVALIGGVGYFVYKNQHKATTASVTTTTTPTPTKSVTATPAKTTTPTPAQDTRLQYENKDLGLTFKYPSDWKIVDESDNLGTLIRVQSPDFVRGDQSVSGTQISVSLNASHNTYSADKQGAATSTYGYHNDVKDLTVGGKPAFSYSKSQNETGYTAFYVEVDLGAKGAREFLYQSETKDVQQKYDTTNLTVFNSLLDSVTFQ